LAIADLQFSI